MKLPIYNEFFDDRDFTLYGADDVCLDPEEVCDMINNSTTCVWKKGEVPDGVFENQTCLFLYRFEYKSDSMEISYWKDGCWEDDLGCFSEDPYAYFRIPSFVE